MMHRLRASVRSRLASRKGFALPLAILVIAALTATLSAAFASVTAEIATNSAQRSESRAFVIATARMIWLGAPHVSPKLTAASTRTGL